MALKRMRGKGDDGLFEVHSMIREFSKRLSDYKSLPTLSEVLVELLNGEALTSSSKGRVERMMQLFRMQKGYESQIFTRIRSKGKAAEGDSIIDLLIDSAVEANSELNDMLLQFAVVPQFHPVAEASTLYYLPGDSNCSPEKQAEVGAVMCAVQLAQRNQIQNVRECSCGKYFVAGRIDQNYCSVKCRVKAHQSSEEFKAKRREADRERYRLHNDGKVKETNRRKDVTQKTR